MEIICLGNEMVDEDSLGPYLAGKLKNPGIRHVRTVDEFERACEENDSLIVIDTAEGIEEITVLEGPESLQNSPIATLHDYDIGFSIRLMQKLGTLPNIRIIAVPKGMDRKQASAEIPGLIESISRKLDDEIDRDRSPYHF